MFKEFPFEEELQQKIQEFPVLDLDVETIILKEHSYIKEIPLVLEGSVKVFKVDETGKEIILYHILPGESCVLSITSCLNDRESKAQAIIEQKTKLITIPADIVKEWMNSFPGWRKFVMKLYYERLDELLSLVDNIAFKQVDHRLIDKLSKLQKEQGDVIKITHQSLANEIGTAREVVSRLLKHLEIEGKLRLERGYIKILKSLKD
jgi:CRP/FNR family transcriptional regulator